MVAENEFRVIGPPGTGKTTFLCEQVERATQAYCDRLNMLPSECHAVLMCSLTKAAANELRGRGIDIPPEQIATLHAHAYRALGKPPLCVSGQPINEWNEYCAEKELPWKLSGEADDSPDRETSQNKTSGDGVLQHYQFERSRLRPRELWTPSLTAFATVYEQWKRDNEYLDFADIIHDAFIATDSAPGCPSVIMVDEAQDNDRAELRLVRKWARSCEKVVIVGDPDQNLYEWRGSEPEAFYETEIPEGNNRILKQSFRVPRTVHAKAMRMISRIRGRRPVEYLPKNAEGEVRSPCVCLTGRGADESIDCAKPYLEAGKRVMFLASCEYMLGPIIHELKDRGLPFWNPFARQRGRFNPLTPAKGVSAGQRILNYLTPQEKYFGNEARLWTWSELHSWVDVCKADGLLRRGLKTEIARRAKEDNGTMQLEDVATCFEPEIVKQMDGDAITLFRRFLKKDRASSVEFALNVLKRRGIADLDKTPQIIVGTIHSVKGGEADVVFVAPDLSPQGHEEYEGRGCNAIFRLFYVAFTRAKESLILCEPGNRMAVDW